MGRVSRDTGKYLDHNETWNKFKPEYCEKLIEMGKQGKSRSQFCSAISICQDTFYGWLKMFKEFHQAYQLFKIHSRAWWEQQGQENLIQVYDAEGGGIKFDTSMWKFTVGGRFGMSSKKENDGLDLSKGNLQKQQKDALKALAQGEISQEQALAISQMILDAAKLEEHTEIKTKLDEIEARLNSGAAVVTQTKEAKEPEYEEDVDVQTKSDGTQDGG